MKISCSVHSHACLVLLFLAGGLWLHGQSAPSAFVRDAEPLDNSWYRTSWFGDVFTNPSIAPWHYHGHLGWLYIMQGSGTDFWLYSPAAASWFYTRADLYPYAYDHRNGWVHFSPDFSGPWYYAYDTLDWINLNAPPMGRPFDKTISMARFLDQTTLGVNPETLESVSSGSIEAWLESQFQIPPRGIRDRVETYVELYDEQTGAEPWFNATWWYNVMTGEDLLRQRVVLALSEIIVVSNVPGTLAENPVGMAGWYEMLQDHAFGNFRDLLYDVTLHPVMGFYLSHAGNRKADEALNRYPDENYAREIMQLFTIGLYELNPDGTRRLDDQGEPIPTYSNREITAFARVFTGLIYDWTAVEDLENLPVNDELFDNLIQWQVRNFEDPMVMVEREHDTGEKVLLNGTVLPAGQSGLDDINAALDNLFNHPNVGPFIGRLLIQRLVKSNPSPGYISRVAAAFNDNGQGVRGDMRAVLRAIILDQEARNLYHMEDPAHGKMREPFLRYIKLLRTFNAWDRSGEYIMADAWKGRTVGQRPFSSPSVFNFFLPDHQPNGILTEMDLVAPEFQITNSQTIPAIANFFEGEMWGLLSDPDDYVPQTVDDVGNPIGEGVRLLWHNPWYIETEPMMEIAEDPAALVDYIALHLTNGAMSEATRQVIIDTISPLGVWDEEYLIRVRIALYLTLLSPEFVISR